MESERLLILVLLIMTILVPVVSAAEQVNNLLDIENPFVYFSEENNTSIYFDFNNLS